jgi:hypothetical protein
MIIPEKSILYFYGLEKDKCDTFDLVQEKSCMSCNNLNCEYREENDEKIYY